MRSLTAAARRAIFAPETSEVFLWLMKLSHPSMTADLRVVNDAQNLISNGDTYQGFPFEITMPSETEDVPPVVQLRIANAGREIVTAVRQLSGPSMTVMLSLVRAASPNDVEAGPFEFNLREVEYDAEFVTGSLLFEDMLNEPCPAETFTPTQFPGLF